MFEPDNPMQPSPQDNNALNAPMPDPISIPPPPAGFSAPTSFNPATNTPIPQESSDSTAPSLPNDDTNLITPIQTPEQPTGSNDLVDIKQQALQQLSPLVSHLDQTPDEKFRTTMMMIQASDNKDLIKDAFDAAKSITDDKARAQALLDVINEINYFTQHDSE